MSRRGRPGRARRRAPPRHPRARPPAAGDASTRACSNFGPLNCVPNLAGGRASHRRRLRPGGVLVASVIGRVCPWEIALVPGARRLARGSGSASRSVLVAGAARRPRPSGRGTTRRASSSGCSSAAGFRACRCAHSACSCRRRTWTASPRRHPRARGALQRLEDWRAAWPGLRAWGDHFLIVLRKM